VQFELFMLLGFFGPYCFLLFDSALQGWGAVMVVGDFLFSFLFGLLLFFWGALRCSSPAPTSRHEVVLFSMSVEADICYSVRFYWCSNPSMKENSCMQNC
jgi:hypothetical protein